MAPGDGKLEKGVSAPAEGVGAAVRENADWLAGSLLLPAKDLVADAAADELMAKGLQNLSADEFFKLGWEKRLQLVSDFKPGEKLSVGRKLTLDFHGNATVELHTYLQDFFPPEVRAIRHDGDVYERRGNQGFYFDGEEHMLIDRATVEIAVLDGDYSAKKTYAEKFGGEYKAPATARLDPVKMAMVAEDFGVDAYLMEAVLRLFMPADVGFNGDEREFVEIVALAVSRAESKYNNRFSPVMAGGHYAGGFLMSLAKVLDGYFDVSMRKDLWKEVVTGYADLRGFKFADWQLEDSIFAVVQSFNDANLPDDPIETAMIGGRTVTGQPVLLVALQLADADFYAATGEHIAVRDSHRDVDMQRKRRIELGYTSDDQPAGYNGLPPAAPPGKSFHQKGLAVDVANWQAAQPYLVRYGLIGGTVGVENEPNHFSMGEMKMNRGFFEEAAIAWRAGRSKGAAKSA